MSQLLSADQHPKAPPIEDRARARIIAAARSHFFALGFRGVTMDDLAAELGMSKTLYASFSVKNDLLRAVLLDKSRSIEADLERISAHSGADVMVALRELLSCAQRYTQEIQPPFVRDIGRRRRKCSSWCRADGVMRSNDISGGCSITGGAREFFARTFLLPSLSRCF